MKQRILIILLTLLTTTTVWAVDINLVASPAGGGTIAFAPDDQNPNNLDYNNLVVIPSSGFFIEKVIHEYSEEGGSAGSLTLRADPMTGYYYVNSNLGGTVTAYFNSTTIKDVHVSFDMNGHPNAVNTPDDQDLQLGQEVTRPTPDPTDNGYVVVGWYMDAACTTPYNFDTKLNISLNYIFFNENRFNLTLYARWAKENSTVTFKANGGTAGTMDAVTQASGTEFVIPSCDFSRADYLFIGWATSADGGVVYKPGEKITLIDDLTLYALWAKENCTVTFKANGGTGTMDAVMKTGGTEFEIPSCGFSFDVDHPYVGWATSALGEVVYHPGDKITLTDDLTLYAKWSYPQTAFTLNGLKYMSNSQISPTVSLIGYDVSQPTGDLVIPGSVTYGGTEYTMTTIGAYAFLGCTGLTSVTIPSSVTTIGEGAFRHCTGLTSVTIPENVTTIVNSAFRDCTGLTSVTIPEGVTTIGEYAFLGCTGLASVTIPASVTTIGYEAFKNCSSLTSVTIPSSVETIGDDAFNSCTGLTSVTIPSSVTTIGEGAFIGCYGLTSVTIFAPSLKNYEGFVFVDNAEGRKIYVPSGSVDTYKDGWNDYASDIEPLDYIIDEGKDVSILSDGTGKNVALKRSFAKGKKQTVCLPYAPKELLNYGKVWAFTGINGGKAEMTEIKDATSLQANTPYIFEAANDLLNITFPKVDISIGSDPKTVDVTAGFTFHGTYTEKIWEATSDEVVNGTIYGFMMKDNDGQTVGQFVKARRRTVLRPFSCYLEYSGGSLTGTASAARGKAQEPLPDAIDIVWLTAGDVGSATGIKEVKSEKSGVEGWFSLDGRRLSGKPTATGIYIHEGKKVVVK